MTTIVHSDFSTRHLGVERAEAAVETARQIRRGFDSAKGLSAMLLAAIVSALLVVADQMVETWADGHLMMAWVVMWSVGFAAIAVLAGTVRRFSAKVIGELNTWAARAAQARADERLWSIALQDARVMADLQTALSREDAEGKLPAKVAALARAHQSVATSHPLPYV